MKKRSLRTGCAALAALVLTVGVFGYQRESKETGSLPELVSYVDTLDGSITIPREEVPLASAPVKDTKTTTKTSTKKIKMKTKATKTAKTTTRKTARSEKTAVSAQKRVETNTTILTTKQTRTKRNSNIKTVKTTVKTTVTTITTALSGEMKGQKAEDASQQIRQTEAVQASAGQSKASIRSLAPKTHTNVLSAFERMGFTVSINPTANYSGRFDARARLIVLQKSGDEAIYHELGHFVSFAAGNVDVTPEFGTIYAAEKDALVASRNNKEYVTSSAEEYFAESYQDYVENPAGLLAARPKTYEFIAAAVMKVTDAQADAYKNLYTAAGVWS
ncbi:MAG: hypothetical protein Q4B57_02995 [Eubacteriales bacterium]|nr:hypothetical protein [Eubacteriales bacterium]